MNRLEVVFESEAKIKIETVQEVLESVGLEYKSIKRLDVQRPKPKQQKEPCCGQGEKQSPSMIKKAKNYLETKKRWHKAGKPLASKKVVIERLAICITCDSLIKDWECSECGCPMMEKAKMGIDKLCELNNW